MEKLKRMLLPAVASVALAIAIVTTAAAAGGDQDKVSICHVAGDKFVEISVAAPALKAHQAHGDTMPDEYGDCSGTIVPPALIVTVRVTCESRSGQPSDEAVCDWVLANVGPADYTVYVTANDASPASFAGNESGTSVSAGPGSYSVNVPFFVLPSGVLDPLQATTLHGEDISASGDCIFDPGAGGAVFLGTIVVGDTQQCDIVITAIVVGGTVPS